NLLMYPDPQHPVPVTLAECEELAPDEGAKNGWELAARFASQMLPQIFRQNSPVLELILPPENQQRLESLLAKLPAETFTASDALGWVYQFWQANKKDKIDASEEKIGARELPVVTQLFTEPYMVSFLLDNSLGAWWAARRLTEDDLKNAESEAELRQKASIPGVPLEYLRFVRDEETGNWIPAAGTFDAWPENLSKLKTLDPCCGSGHFLMSALLMLTPMRAELEGLSQREACDAVLRDNLHGLELDQRCVEIAAFALALTGWRYAGYRVLPKFNLACSGLTINADIKDWLVLAGEDRTLGFAMEQLYKQFQYAPILGSLINPEVDFAKGSLFESKWDDIQALLSKALTKITSDDALELGVVAQGIARAAEILTDRYELIVTNPPYLARGKQSDDLKEYIDFHYKAAKNDLANVFLERCLKIAASGGVVQFVMPQNWLFLISYKSHREYLLKNMIWCSLSRLGMAAFEVMDWWAFNVILITLMQAKPADNHRIYGLDVSKSRQPEEKAGLLREILSYFVTKNNSYRIQTQLSPLMN
ncbi:MAG: Eco57I restriction-modification methylase domain-containing protein, partial [Gemmataceae bacterium]